ncbi:helix-turn-helix domain-containing protein [Nostoc sp.]|uniref:helix-turn-helix domain-containing protein n=1 Tax=Nostoc sp. TaxID=1180 RepID=UPI002FFADED6
MLLLLITEIRYLLPMISAPKSRRLRATPEGLEKVVQRMAKLEKFGEKKDKRGWSQEDLADRSGVSLSTVKRFLKPEPVDQNSIIWITRALDLDPLDVINPDEWNQSTTNSELGQKILIHRQVCQGMLEKQGLTINLLMAGGGTTFKRGDIYVPLGLIERKQQRQLSSEESSNQPTEYEVTRTLQHDEFFEQVLRLGVSPKSKGKRIAIIGEPGAGKTTLLQQIADWLFDNIDQDVAIWVSLADLQARTLEDYLLQV